MSDLAEKGAEAVFACCFEKRQEEGEKEGAGAGEEEKPKE